VPLQPLPPQPPAPAGAAEAHAPAMGASAELSYQRRLEQLRALRRKLELRGTPEAEDLAVQVRQRITDIECGEDPDDYGDWVTDLIDQLDAG
jgi:hypothetical protein